MSINIEPLVFVPTIPEDTDDTYPLARLQRIWDWVDPDVLGQRVPRLQSVDVRAIAHIKLAHNSGPVLLSSLLSLWVVVVPHLLPAKAAKLIGRRHSWIIAEAGVLVEKSSERSLAAARHLKRVMCERRDVRVRNG